MIRFGTKTNFALKKAKCCTYVVPNNFLRSILNKKSRRFLFGFCTGGETRTPTPRGIRS